MYRDNTRVAWQREIYQNHFAPGKKIKDFTGFLRIILLLLAIALSASVFSPVYFFEGFGNGYILLIKQHLPGLAGYVDKKPIFPSEADFTLKEAYSRLLLGSMPAGFSGEEKTEDTSLKEVELPPTIEHLIFANSGTGESSSATAAADPPLSLLVAPGSSAPETYPIPQKNEPRILIYHTHTTESFLPVSGKPFTSDLEHSVVFLGEYLGEILETEYGIPVLHNYEIFDIPRSDAYNQARPVISAILEENPQIEVVVDLHRDGISREITTFSLNGEDTARILFVVGTRHAGWNSNLRFALFLQNVMNEKYPGLCRGTRQQAVTYNQHVHPRSVLVEIGSHENNREEVLRAVPHLAETLAEAFY